MKINNTIINTKNISYITHEKYDSSGYTWKKNWVIYIHFIGSEKSLTFEFFDREEFEEVFEQLNNALMEKENKDEQRVGLS